MFPLRKSFASLFIIWVTFCREEKTFSVRATFIPPLRWPNFTVSFSCLSNFSSEIMWQHYKQHFSILSSFGDGFSKRDLFWEILKISFILLERMVRVVWWYMGLAVLRTTVTYSGLLISFYNVESITSFMVYIKVKVVFLFFIFFFYYFMVYWFSPSSLARMLTMIHSIVQSCWFFFEFLGFHYKSLVSFKWFEVTHTSPLNS